MNKQACQTKELMVEAVQAMKNLAQEQGIQLSFKPNDLIVWADRDYIVQTLTNLVSNAIKFSPPKSTVMLFASPQKNRDRVLKDTASCSISSSGETPPTLFRASHLAEALPHRQNQSISYITFAVQDRGQGIPQDRLETIFERFQQVDSSDSRKKGGTGLGLAICRQIVEGHGGQIWAESGLENGSTFYFTLPELIQ